MPTVFLNIDSRGHLRTRKFDHDEARRLRATGLSHRQIAERFGVTGAAIYRAVKAADPDWAEWDRIRSRDWQREHLKMNCSRCGAEIWKPVGKNRASTWTGLCRACVGATNRIYGIRETELQCSRCGEYKPDSAFPRCTRNKSRRGRHKYCSACSTIARREYRERNKVPCVDCGTPCSPSGTEGRRTAASVPPRCQRCAQRARSDRQAA